MRGEARARHRWEPWAGVPVLLAVLLAAACSGGEQPRSSQEAVPRPTVSPPAAVTPARYVTDFAFSGFSGAAPAALLRFRNDVTSAELARRYRVWVKHGTRWDTALALSDTLPVPRATWRILPGRDLRVLAASGGEVAGLLLRGGSRTVQLVPGKVLDEWTSPTGQRSRLLLASWAAGGEPATGLLFERREARPLDLPPPRTLEEAVLATDSAGNGVLLLRDVGDEDSTATATTAYTWLAGQEARWPESGLDLRATSAGQGWNVRIPDAELELTARFGPSVVEDAVMADTAPGGAGVRLRPLRGSLRLAGRTRPAHGLVFVARGP